MKKDYYKILLVSQSGKGKTYSFRNMDPDTTGFLNVENQPLPFTNNFKHYNCTNNIAETKTILKKYANTPEIDCIVFDSLSAYLDMVLQESRATKRGFDIWNNYNEETSKFLKFIKTIQKEVFITAHYEWVQDGDGAKEKRTKTKGKEWEGVIEKEFVIVLYVDKKMNAEQKKIEAWFDLALDDSSAKCPPTIFGETIFQIPNDSKLVLDKIQEFTK